MAQWQEVQQLENTYLEQVHQLYSEEHLPMDVRQYLAPWLEDQNWSRAAEPPAAEPHSAQAHMLFHTLLALLDDQYSRFGASEDDFVLKHNLRKSKLNLQANYQECPEQLANVIANLLREEKAILSRGLTAQQAAAQPPSSAPMETDRQQKIERRLAETRAAVQVGTARLSRMPPSPPGAGFEPATRWLHAPGASRQPGCAHAPGTPCP
uniref:STAT transcription factor protein interaction domain-containing protein n=1 Tax=Terrapene triunguis TaxID=2587831 RepID=A0A674K203_9SAUR